MFELFCTNFTTTAFGLVFNVLLYAICQQREQISKYLRNLQIA